MLNSVRDENSQDESCEADQGEGDGVLLECHEDCPPPSAYILFRLGRPLTILGFADVGATET